MERGELTHLFQLREYNSIYLQMTDQHHVKPSAVTSLIHKLLKAPVLKSMSKGLIEEIHSYL